MISGTDAAQENEKYSNEDLEKVMRPAFGF